ncbi:MAG: hypothetical protein FWE67_11030 [Planctomycetaceae bacterium]|nr:hypothetical protein [Planctomycetaceae bacterium]
MFAWVLITVFSVWLLQYIVREWIGAAYNIRYMSELREAIANLQIQIDDLKRELDESKRKVEQ